MNKLFEAIRNGAGYFSDVLFPPHCVVCETGLVTGETDVCAGCLSSLPTWDEAYSPESLYQRLSIELHPSYVWAYLLFDHKNKTQKILHAIKYGDTPDIAVRLSAIWADRIKGPLSQAGIDSIIPIPLHAGKKRKRGYNQAALIAQGFQQVVDIPIWEDVLVRRKNRFIQARSKRVTRFENVKEVYAGKNTERIKGKHVLIVDDVLTTGATLEACGVLLKKAGAAKVSVAVLAMVAD